MPDPKPKRPAPFCIRLSEGERARLVGDAGGLPLGAYIKSRIFGSTDSGRGEKPDRQLLARLLAVFGQSDIASNIEELAKAARSGSLPLTPEVDSALRRAAADIAEMRRMLMAALGMRGLS